MEKSRDLKDFLWYGAALLVFFGVFVLILRPAGPPTRPETNSMLVARVLDGDTVVLASGVKVRYLGINTQETGEPFAAEATARNRELTEGKAVRLETDQRETDAYGRLLAHVFVGETLVNEVLLKEGLANMMFLPPNRKYYDRYLAAQKEAQREGRGIWALEEFQIPLKITSFRPGKQYLRFVNLASRDTNFQGWALRNERGRVFLLPDITVKPGYTVVVEFREGEPLLNPGDTQVLYWPDAGEGFPGPNSYIDILDPEGRVRFRKHVQS